MPALPRNGNPFPRKQSASFSAVLSLLLLITLPSCSERTKRMWSFHSPEENYRLALEAESPDERRKAVTRIGESGYVAGEEAFAVLDAVARTDPSQYVRCVAVTAFTRYGDGRPVPTLIAILQATPESRTDALPAGNELRAAAAGALADLNARGLVTDEYRAAACDIFLKLADATAPRQCRIVALRALGTFHDSRVFAPLTAALREQDFAIADTAERSLIALTGRTHNYDPDAWNKWLANTEDPFAHAGEAPPTSQPAGPSWWDAEKRKWEKFLKPAR